MTAYSIPSFIMVVVTVYVGIYHLLLYFRRHARYHEDLTFALCCFSMALYGVHCVGMYNARSIAQGITFQRGQVATLSLIGTTFLWFVVDYLKLRKTVLIRILSPFFLISAAYVLFDRTPITFKLDQPLIKTITFLQTNKIVYYEVKPGIYIEFLSFMGMMIFVYASIMSIREWRTGDKRKAKAMLIAISIFWIGLINDVLVHFGVYKSFYVIEYGYMGIVLLMATSLTNEVVESALRKEALEESEKKYRELVDNALIGIFIVQDQAIQFCNQRFAEIFGYDRPAEITGKNWAEFGIPDDQNEIRQNMQMTQEEKTNHKHMEFRGVKRNGEIIDIQSFFGYIVLDHRPAIQGTLIDITARKSAEKQLKESADQLKRYTLELEQFVSVTSHHLQEPLRSISSYVQLLAKRYQDQLDQKAHEYIGFAVDGVDRMHRLINDFLIYTRVGKSWGSKHEMSLDGIVERVIGYLEKNIAENEVNIAIEPLPTVYGEEAKLELLFRNLIINAIIYKGSDPSKIQIFAKENDDTWQIGVQDNGIGIAPEYHRLIFGMFQKLNKKNNIAGTGIGLSICKRIVEQHHGEIWVESEEGDGAVFYFTLEKTNGH